MKQQVLNTYAMTLENAKKLVADVDCPDCAKSPYDEAKHPAWVLTHLCLGSGLAESFLDPRAGLGLIGAVPEAWMSVSAPNVPISNERSAFPSKHELISELERVHASVAQKYTDASDELLASEFPNPDYRSFFPTVGDGAFYMMAYHEGWHLGQMSQWRRAAGYPPLG